MEEALMSLSPRSNDVLCGRCCAEIIRAEISVACNDWRGGGELTVLLIVRSA